MPEKTGQSAKDKQTQDTDTEEQQTQDPLEKYGEKFKGKSLDDVVQMYQNAEKQIGEKEHKMKELEQEKMAYENWYNSMRSQGQQGNQGTQYGGQYGSNPYQQSQNTQQVPGEDSTGSTSWWDNPDEAARRAFRNELRQYDQQRRYQDAFSRATTAESLARQQFPDAFKDLEPNEVRNLLYSGVQGGAIAPDVIANPEGWAMAAGQIQLRKRNFKLDSSSKPSEPADTGTEAPEATKTQPYGDSDSVRLTSQDRALMEKFKISEKEAMEIKKAEAQERERQEQ